jgi:hypothetical protein
VTAQARWLRRAGAVLIAVGTLAGCATSTSGHPPPAAHGTLTPVTPGPPTGTGTPQGFPTEVPALAGLVSKALLSTTSVHLVLTINAAGQAISGEGDQTVEHGQSKDSSMILTIPGSGTERLVTVDGKTYVMLPTGQRTSNKPWALVTAKSSNRSVQILAQAMSSYSAAFSGTDAAKVFLSASDKLSVEGTSQLGDGTQVVRYALDVRTDRLPDSYPVKASLVQFGLKTLPTELAIDATGHIRQLQQELSFKFHGVTVKTATRIEMSDYNAPVSISAPPPDQVALR